MTRPVTNFLKARLQLSLQLQDSPKEFQFSMRLQQMNKSSILSVKQWSQLDQRKRMTRELPLCLLCSSTKIQSQINKDTEKHLYKLLCKNKVQFASKLCYRCCKPRQVSASLVLFLMLWETSLTVECLQYNVS